MRNRFGSLRNAHVQLKSVENYPSYNLEPLEKAIKSCKKSEKRRVLKALRKMGPDSDNHLFEDVKKSISDQALKMTKNQAKLKLIAAIRSSLRDLSVSHQLDPKGFHKTRIAVKRIHYQEEILQKLLGVKFVNLWDLRRFQRLAGLIKDNRMFLKQLKHFHKKEDGIRKKDVKQLSITLAKDQNKYMSSNLKSFDSLKRGKWAP